MYQNTILELTETSPFNGEIRNLLLFIVPTAKQMCLFSCSTQTAMRNNLHRKKVATRRIYHSSGEMRMIPQRVAYINKELGHITVAKGFSPTWIDQIITTKSNTSTHKIPLFP